MLVVRSVISVLCTTPPKSPDKGMPKEIRSTKSIPAPVDQVETLLGHILWSPLFRLSTSLYLQAEPPHKPNSIEVQPFSCCSEVSSTGKANSKSRFSLIKYIHPRPRDLLGYKVIKKKKAPSGKGLSGKAIVSLVKLHSGGSIFLALPGTK